NHRHRLAKYRAPRAVERHRGQLPIARAVYQIPRANPVRAGAEQQVRLAHGVERQHAALCDGEFGAIVQRQQRELARTELSHEPAAARECGWRSELRREVHDGVGAATRGRDAMEFEAIALEDENLLRREPYGSGDVAHFGDGDGIAAVRRHLAQEIAGYETDPRTIGRIEGIGRTLGTR